MPLTVKWDSGIAIEYNGTKLMFDPQKNNNSYSDIFITHAHYDHSKGFAFKNPEKASTEKTKEIVATYGKEINHWKPFPIKGRVKIGDLEILSHNAGHVLGSALYEIITPEGNIVYTGDFQYKDSFTLNRAEPVSCDILIIESTFGNPSFIFPERETIAQNMVQWAEKTYKNGKVPTFKTDSLGNAQEIIKAFNLYSKLPVTVHRKIARINEIYNSSGQNLKFFESLEENLSNESVLIEPKNFNIFNNSKLEPALVSGWTFSARKDENAFALSDHADFQQLIDYVDACKPSLVLTCFGRYSDIILAKQIEKRIGIEARPLSLISTKFVHEPTDYKVNSCMKEILKVLKLPGFVYSLNWVKVEMKSQGFKDYEVDVALSNLTRRGMLKSSNGFIQNG